MLTFTLFCCYLSLFFTLPALGEWFFGPKQSWWRGLFLASLVGLSFRLIQLQEPPIWLLAGTFLAIFLWIYLPNSLEKRLQNSIKSGQEWGQSKLPKILSWLTLEGSNHLYLILQKVYPLLLKREDDACFALIEQKAKKQKDLLRFYSEILDLFRMARRYEDGVSFYETKIAPNLPAKTSESIAFTLCRLYSESGQFKKSYQHLQALESLPYSEFLHLHILVGYLVFYALAGARERFLELVSAYPVLSQIPYFSHWKGILLVRAGAMQEGETLLKASQNQTDADKPFSFPNHLQRYFQKNSNDEEIAFAREIRWKPVEKPTFQYYRGFKFESWSWMIFLSLLQLLVFFYYVPIMNLDYLNLGALTELTLQGEPFRFFSSAFLHGNWLHFGSNLVSFFVLAPAIEIIFGRFQLSFLLLFSVFIGNLFSLYYTPLSLSIGISGGVCGLFGAFITYNFFVQKKLPPTLFKRFLLVSSILIGLTVYMGMSIPQINNWAHLGGFLGGMFGAFFLLLWNRISTSPKKSALFFGVLLLSILGWTGWGWADLLSHPYPKAIVLTEMDTLETNTFSFKVPKGWKLELLANQEFRFQGPSYLSMDFRYNAYPSLLPKEFFENDFVFQKEEVLPSLKWSFQIYQFKDPQYPITLLYFYRSFSGMKTCNLYYAFNANARSIESVTQWITPLLEQVALKE